MKEDFAKLIDMGAVDMIHPDLASAGGILETKKIGDYAQEHGVPMAMHFAGTPVSFMANVHCAAATENFLALEHHSLEVPWWEDLVTGSPKPIVKDGFATSRTPRARRRAQPRHREGAPAQGRGLLRAHDAVGHREIVGSSLELGLARLRRLPSQVLAEELDRALPGQLRGRLVVARRGVVVEAVLGARVDERLVRDACSP